MCIKFVRIKFILFRINSKDRKSTRPPDRRLREENRENKKQKFGRHEKVKIYVVLIFTTRGTDPTLSLTSDRSQESNKFKV